MRPHRVWEAHHLPCFHMSHIRMQLRLFCWPASSHEVDTMACACAPRPPKPPALQCLPGRGDEGVREYQQLVLRMPAPLGRSLGRHKRCGLCAQGQWFPKCGPWASSISVSWGLIRNANYRQWHDGPWPPGQPRDNGGACHKEMTHDQHSRWLECRSVC